MKDSNQKNKTKMDEFDFSNPMSHQEATALDAVELYVLQDLTPEQELRFEAHYFECEECAHAVAVEQALLEVAPPEPQPWWRRLAFPVLVPATAALLGLAGVESFYAIPSLKAEVADLTAPQATAEITAHEIQLGDEKSEAVHTPSVTVGLPLHGGATFPFYRVKLSDEGKPAGSLVLPAPSVSRLSLHLTKPAPGSYAVFVCGIVKQDSTDCPQAWQYHFNIRNGDLNAKHPN